MDFKFVPMTIEHVIEIEQWKYNGYMKEIYMKPYHDNYNPTSTVLKGPANCDGFAVYEEDALIGLFEYYVTEKRIEIGLALHPDMVGKGYSTSFIDAGIQFIHRHYSESFDTVWLSVEQENKAAYYAYLKAGFKIDHVDENEVVMKKQIQS